MYALKKVKDLSENSKQDMSRKSKIFGGLFLSVLIFVLSCHSKEKEQPFSLQTQSAMVLKTNGPEIFQYWEFRNEPFLWDTNFVQPPAIKGYQDSLSMVLTEDTLRQLVQKMAFQDHSFAPVDTENGDSINAQLIHANILGKIRPINYLEAQVLDYQISRYPLFSHPTECHGFILFHDSLSLVRTYFAASDQPWPPKPGVILAAMEEDLKNGWTFQYHLHNHYEHPQINMLAYWLPVWQMPSIILS